MFGLTEDAILAILEKDIPNQPKNEIAQFVRKKLLPNIVEAIAANNEAILFQLKEESSEYDSKY